MAGVRAGATIEQMARVVADKHGPSRDLTLDIACHLALAWLSLMQLKEAGVDLTLGRSELLEPLLKRAWRELLEARLRVSPEQLDTSVLSRYGRIYRVGDVSDSPARVHNGDSES